MAIEILSEGNRKLDETIKRQRYEHYGIPEYWIIDPALDLPLWAGVGPEPRSPRRPHHAAAAGHESAAYRTV